MPTDDERREVARRLRDLPGDSTYPDLIGVIADRDGWYPAADAADRLADLIEPTCDRDALLELADSVQYAGENVSAEHRYTVGFTLRNIADRIREALGVPDKRTTDATTC